MSRRCELTGKAPQVGHKVSHSNIKTKRRFLPNLLNVTLMSDALGRSVRLRVSANAFKPVDHRGGLDAFLAKAKDSELRPRRSTSSARSRRRSRRTGELTFFHSFSFMLPVRSAGLGSATVDRPWPLRFYFIPSCLWTFQKSPKFIGTLHCQCCSPPIRGQSRSAGNLTRVPQADTQPSREWNRHATTHPAIDAMVYRRESDRMAAAFCSGRERSGRSPGQQPLQQAPDIPDQKLDAVASAMHTGGQPEGALRTAAQESTPPPTRRASPTRPKAPWPRQ